MSLYSLSWFNFISFFSLQLMILQTDKNKRARLLDKAVKELSDAMWRKKKKQQKENADSGVSLAGSEISEKPIKHSDSASIASAAAIYKTSYSQLAGRSVVDFIEQAPPIKTLPLLMRDPLQELEVQQMDKYAQKHYATLKANGLKSWESMDGSTMTASVYSASTRFGPDALRESYEEYNTIRANKSMIVAPSSSSGISTAASSRVGSLLQTRSTSTASTIAGGAAATGAGSVMSTSNSSGVLPEYLSLLSMTLGSKRSLRSPNASRSVSPSGNSLAGGGGMGGKRGAAVSKSTASRTGGKNTKAPQQKLSGSNSQIRLAPLQTSEMSNNGGAIGSRSAGNTAPNSAVPTPSSTARGAGGPSGGMNTFTTTTTTTSQETFGIGESEFDAHSEFNSNADYMADGGGLEMGSAVSLLSGGGGGDDEGGRFAADGGLGSPTGSLLSLSLAGSPAPSLGSQSSLYQRQQQQQQRKSALDPVFFKDQARTKFGRSHAVGKLRKAEAGWGMKGFKDPYRVTSADGETEESTASAAAGATEDDAATVGGNSTKSRSSSSLQRNNTGLSTSSNDTAATAAAAPTAPTIMTQAQKRAALLREQNKLLSKDFVEANITVKSRSLTVYHPEMHIFKGSIHLPPKSEE
jgi:hypothetical protein